MSKLPTKDHFTVTMCHSGEMPVLPIQMHFSPFAVCSILHTNRGGASPASRKPRSQPLANASEVGVWAEVARVIANFSPEPQVPRHQHAPSSWGWWTIEVSLKFHLLEWQLEALGTSVCFHEGYFESEDRATQRT